MAHGLQGVVPEADLVLARFAQAGVDVGALAARLQEDGAKAFTKSWEALLQRIAGKASAVGAAR